MKPPLSEGSSFLYNMRKGLSIFCLHKEFSMHRNQEWLHFAKKWPSQRRRPKMPPIDFIGA
jgi:hypothetical protein